MQIHNISVDELRQSKVFVKEGSGISFPSSKEFADRFTDIFSDSEDIVVQAQSPVVNAELEGKLNIAYPRVMIEASYKPALPGFTPMFGMVYSLETAKPVIKVYSGYNVRACMNLHIFNAEKVFEQPILGNIRDIYPKLQEFKIQKEKEAEEFKRIYDDLRTHMYTEGELNETLGRILRSAGKSKIGTNAVMEATKLLDDPSSNYYVNKGDNFACSAYNLYNAVTYYISNKGEFTEKPNKTVKLAQLFLN